MHLSLCQYVMTFTYSQFNRNTCNLNCNFFCKIMQMQIKRMSQCLEWAKNMILMTLILESQTLEGLVYGKNS